MKSFINQILKPAKRGEREREIKEENKFNKILFAEAKQWPERTFYFFENEKILQESLK